MGNERLESPPLMNTRVSIMEEQQLIILVTWPQSSAKIYCDIVLCIPIMILFPHALMSQRPLVWHAAVWEWMLTPA